MECYWKITCSIVIHRAVGRGGMLFILCSISIPRLHNTQRGYSHVALQAKGILNNCFPKIKINTSTKI